MDTSWKEKLGQLETTPIRYFFSSNGKYYDVRQLIHEKRIKSSIYSNFTKGEKKKLKEFCNSIQHPWVGIEYGKKKKSGEFILREDPKLPLQSIKFDKGNYFDPKNYEMDPSFSKWITCEWRDEKTNQSQRFSFRGFVSSENIENSELEDFAGQKIYVPHQDLKVCDCPPFFEIWGISKPHPIICYAKNVGLENGENNGIAFVSSDIYHQLKDSNVKIRRSYIPVACKVVLCVHRSIYDQLGENLQSTIYSQILPYSILYENQMITAKFPNKSEYFNIQIKQVYGYTKSEETKKPYYITKKTTCVDIDGGCFPMDICIEDKDYLNKQNLIQPIQWKGWMDCNSPMSKKIEFELYTEMKLSGFQPKIDCIFPCSPSDLFCKDLYSQPIKSPIEWDKWKKLYSKIPKYSIHTILPQSLHSGFAQPTGIIIKERINGNYFQIRYSPKSFKWYSFEWKSDCYPNDLLGSLPCKIEIVKSKDIISKLKDGITICYFNMGKGNTHAEFEKKKRVLFDESKNINLTLSSRTKRFIEKMDNRWFLVSSILLGIEKEKCVQLSQKYFDQFWEGKFNSLKSIYIGKYTVMTIFECFFQVMSNMDWEQTFKKVPFYSGMSANIEHFYIVWMVVNLKFIGFQLSSREFDFSIVPSFLLSKEYFFPLFSPSVYDYF